MDRKKKTRYMPVLAVLGAFVLVTAALIGQNIWRSRTRSQPVVRLLEREAFAGQETVVGLLSLQREKEYECLYLWDSQDGNSQIFHKQMPQILQDMKVSAVEVDIRKEQMPDLNQYGFEKVVIGFADYSYAREELQMIMQWVKEGGQVLAALIPETSNTADWLNQIAGIKNEGIDFYETAGIWIADGFMLTGNRQSYEIEDSFWSSRVVALEDECKIYMETDDSGRIPLLWEKQYGEGKMVVLNLGIYEKAYRGIYGAAYSLLGSVCVYPVINASTFFIDDFPLPVIDRNFYSHIWWGGVEELAAEYDFPYTVTILESYSDRQTAPFEKNEERWQYQYFGNLIMEGGGEVGFHGYNHMPLVLDPFDFGEEFPDYEPWRSREDMRESLKALEEFCRDLFLEERFQVYVPPSNILSEEGREVIALSFPEIRSIAGAYLPGKGVCGQEFEEGPDGVIDTPRIAFGYKVEGEDQIAAMSELNLHFVNTHCQYPEDALKAENGEEPEWEEMLDSFTEYVDWLYKAAPDIRSMTGSELAAAVQRFSYLGVEKEETEELLTLTLGQFVDQAWLMIRFNDFLPDLEAVEGGSLTKMTGNLYLLKAENERVTIKKLKG